jgi:hypothetical protein
MGTYVHSPGRFCEAHAPTSNNMMKCMKMVELGLIYVAEKGYMYAASRVETRAQGGDRIYSNAIAIKCLGISDVRVRWHGNAPP